MADLGGYGCFNAAGVESQIVEMGLITNTVELPYRYSGSWNDVDGNGTATGKQGGMISYQPYHRHETVMLS